MAWNRVPYDVWKYRQCRIDEEELYDFVYEFYDKKEGERIGDDPSAGWVAWLFLENLLGEFAAYQQHGYMVSDKYAGNADDQSFATLLQQCFEREIVNAHDGVEEHGGQDTTHEGQYDFDP